MVKYFIANKDSKLKKIYWPFSNLWGHLNSIEKYSTYYKLGFRIEFECFHPVSCREISGKIVRRKIHRLGEFSANIIPQVRVIHKWGNTIVRELSPTSTEIYFYYIFRWNFLNFVGFCWILSEVGSFDSRHFEGGVICNI